MSCFTKSKCAWSTGLTRTKWCVNNSTSAGLLKKTRQRRSTRRWIWLREEPRLTPLWVRSLTRWIGLCLTRSYSESAIPARRVQGTLRRCRRQTRRSTSIGWCRSRSTPRGLASIWIWPTIAWSSTTASRKSVRWKSSSSSATRGVNWLDSSRRNR